MSEAVAEKPKSGFLTKMFWDVAKLVTVGLASAVAWQMFLDPIFFPIFHDPTNQTAQAFVHFIHSTFLFIPKLVGLLGDGGLLHTAFAQSVLAPHYAAIAPTPDTVINKAFEGGLSMDNIGNAAGLGLD